MGRSRYIFGESPFPHFLTCTVVGWLPVFTRPETVQILLDSWQFLQDQDRLTLLGYVVPALWSRPHESVKLSPDTELPILRGGGSDDSRRRL
jgi:hypothetical protein